MSKTRTLTLILTLCAVQRLGASADFVPPRLMLEAEPVPMFAPAPAPEPPPAVRLAFEIPKYRMSELDRETVAACLVLESASQGELGMHGVMAVIRNRAHGRPELFAFTVLREKQFSALNKHTAGRESLWRVIQRAKSDPTWTRALAFVDAAQRSEWHDPTGGATHYTRSAERTAWTRSLAKTVTIGAHSFYR